jgi:glycerol-3-phosphate dehydrogenase
LVDDLSAQPGVYDLAVIGGGINGCGIARDAVGRGWSVYLCEAKDFASGTSSASTKLIHGGLRYLEYYEFRLVREALMEREVLWGIAPHIIWPLRFVLPHHKKLRPAWLLRLGLFLYDHLGGRKRLPATRTVFLRRDPTGRLLKSTFTLGFEYSDCWVEDARLVVLNARDAADRGATIAPRTRCVRARRDGGLWLLDMQDETTGKVSQIKARALVNAAGPWVGDVLQNVLHIDTPAHVRLVQGSHIVVPRLYPENHCYIFQNDDQRIFFVIPYERDFTLIGTTDQEYEGNPAEVHATDAEVRYLCAGASEYLQQPVTADQVVWTYSGVRPLYDDGASKAQAATRDYVLHLDGGGETAPLLSVFGGKITTYRRLAESALAKLAPLLPAATNRPAGWTGGEALPGGNFPVDGFEAELTRVTTRYPFLTSGTARRLLRAYGTKVHDLLAGASRWEDLGEVFGADLTAAEVKHLVRQEWVMRAEDAVWRRTKLGLRLSKEEIARVDAYIAGLHAGAEARV